MANVFTVNKKVVDLKTFWHEKSEKGNKERLNTKWNKIVFQVIKMVRSLILFQWYLKSNT